VLVLELAEMNTKIYGTIWSEYEVSLCVDSYFEHLMIELQGGSFVKSHLYDALSKRTGRTPKSIERKFQNISAVLDVIGREWIKGLAPLANYQELLAEKIALRVQTLDSLPVAQESKFGGSGFEEEQAFVWGPPPVLQKGEAPNPDFIDRLIRRFDPVERDMRNRALGLAGEEFALNQEKQFLTLVGRSDLANSVRWVSKEEGDGAGYDILSFTDRGDKRYIEVKTTVGGAYTPFFISRNEYAFSRVHVESYSLFRLHDFRKNVRGFELRGPLDEHAILSAETLRAEFKIG
jgi:Domain of unknown function (DUF3883)